MRRADRLFQLVQLIRGRRLSTAAWLAQRLQVSVRTVYRDVADLQHQGVPLEGEAGVGYRLGRGFDLPPLMFSANEALALVAAVRLAQRFLDTAMAQEAQEALERILSVLPAGLRAQAQALALYAPVTDSASTAALVHLPQLRQAVLQRRKVCIHYRDQAGAVTQRQVRPLACLHWGAVWTLAAWCEQRRDFRSFRIDRIQQIVVLEQRFQNESGKTLADLLRREGAKLP